MKIYVQRMFLCHNTSDLKAICSITLNDEFNINNVRIVKTSDKRLIVVMPGKLDSQGKFFDLAHPIKREVREELEKVVLEEYKQMTTGGKTNE